jgi:hypothetical protein
MQRLGPVLVSARPDIVVLEGGVNSTLAGALTAVRLGIYKTTVREFASRHLSPPTCPRLFYFLNPDA